LKDLGFLKNSVIAHRGIYDNERIFENTLQSISRAIKYHIIIELDVILTGDGCVVCFHDDNLNRMLHVDEWVRKTTYEDLTFMSKYQIPTLDKALELINGSVPVIIELKGKSKKHLLEKKVMEILDNYNGVFLIQSFNLNTLKYLKKCREYYILGYIIGKNNFQYRFFYKKYDFLNVNINLISDKQVRHIRENKFVIGYTIDNKKTYKEKKDVYDALVLDNVIEILDL